MKRQAYLRVDNRLLHGQVVQFWIPHLGVQRLIIADDEVAKDPSIQVIYRLALPEVVTLIMIPVDCLTSELERHSALETLILMKDIASAMRVLKNGMDLKCVTLGNIHASPERTRITDSIFLSEDEIQSLCELLKMGIGVEIQTFPGDALRLVMEKGGVTKWVRC